MNKVIGNITIAIVLVSLGAAGVLTPIAMAFVEAIQPSAIVLTSGWNGFMRGGQAAEQRLICNRQGENCRVEGQQ
jgi:hypothetical protein